MVAWQFEAIGTRWQIDSPTPIAGDARAQVHARIEDFDRVFSRFRPDSVVAEMAAAGGRWRLPAEAAGLFALYDALHEATGGAVNPLIGRTLADLGYDANYSLTPVETPAAVPAWSSLTFDAPWVTSTEPLLLDVGAAGKGLLVDLVSGLLGDGVTVNASGDLIHRGPEKLRVALEHPADPGQAIGIAELEPGMALCASATNRRTWGEGLHHVLDGRTGRPASQVVATWVVADSCLWADGLATAHFFAAGGELMARFEHEFVCMYADGRAQWSPTFPGEVFR